MKILTLNTALLTACGGIIEIAPKTHQRAVQIAAKILTLDEQPDIVCFQEVFDSKCLSRIIDILKEEYQHHVIDTRIPAFLFGVNSGLAIFSKFKILDHTLLEYPQSTGDCFFARKGIMGIRISVEGKEICVFNTHMQAGGNTKWYQQPMKFVTPSLSTRQIRYLQLQYAKEKIAEFAGDSEYLFVGDFNINMYDKKSFSDPKTGEIISVASTISRVFPNISFTLDDTKGDKYSTYDNKMLDYILSNGLKCESWITDFFKETDTDHKGVFGEFF